jgi:hypothetical protein
VVSGTIIAESIRFEASLEVIGLRVRRDHYIHYNVEVPRRTQPFSIRLGETAEVLVSEEVRRSGRPRSAVVEELAEEAAKSRVFPGVAFRGSPRRAWVIGSGLDVWEIVDLLRAYDGNRKKLLDSHPLLTERHLRLAQSYAERFPAEVDRHLTENRRPLEELEQLYPFLQVEQDTAS